MLEVMEMDKISSSGIKKNVNECIWYFCDQCDHSAKYECNLKIHKETRHDGKRYNCDQCDYQGKQKALLQLHTEAKHNGIKYKCTQCDYIATYNSELKTHQRSQH